MCTIDPVMKLSRRLIGVPLPVIFMLLALACGGSLELPPSATPTRVPVFPPTAPALPAATATPALGEDAPTNTPAPEAPTSTATSLPVGILDPVSTPVVSTPEPTEPAEALAARDQPIEFEPAQLVQGGATIVYLNLPATAATMTFGGLQYPMLFDGVRWWAIAGVSAFAEPGIAPVLIAYNPADGSGQAAAESSVEIVARGFPVENIELDPETSALLDPGIVNNEEAIRDAIFAGYTTQRLWDGGFQAPATGVISSTYGVGRSYNGGPVTSFHRGTDFAGLQGDPVYAAAAGRVVFVDELQVRGNTVIMDHGVGVFTAYNHLSAFAVSAGESVVAGQPIGQIGSTGLVTGPHLHWEVVVRSVEVDGELWLSGAVAP